MGEIAFQKYKTRGADNHWRQIPKRHLGGYNAFVHARYTVIVNHVKDAIDNHHTKTDENIKILDMGCGGGVLLYLLTENIIKNSKYLSSFTTGFFVVAVKK
jgi:2-polyprenyl-3-methyl-5-hydroxy-6-metoxy-1,4-benzoquinol methylase